jgi:hypothetical protein
VPIKKFFKKGIDISIKIWYYNGVKGKKQRRTKMIDREKYLTKVIHFWGFEHPNTIKFAELIENAPDEEVIEAFWNIMKVF